MHREKRCHVHSLGLIFVITAIPVGGVSTLSKFIWNNLTSYDIDVNGGCNYIKQEVNDKNTHKFTWLQSSLYQSQVSDIYIVI